MASVNSTLVYSDSVIGLLQDAWTASGDFMQYLWVDKVLPVVGVEPATHYFWILGFWLNYVFHFVFTGIFTLIELWDWPKFMRKYKIQPGTNENVTVKRVFQIAKVVFFNLTVVDWPFLMAAYQVSKIRYVPDIYTLPSLATFLYHFAVCIILDDAGYYFIHRFILHNRRFYKHVHKKHHEMPAPMAIGSLYSSVFEHFINLFTVCIGPMLLPLHTSTLILWTLYANVLPVHNHLGYEVPYLFFLFPPASKHDFHHENPVNEMYGKNSIFDYLFGTDKRWRASMARKKVAAQQQVQQKSIESKQK